MNKKAALRAGGVAALLLAAGLGIVGCGAPRAATFHVTYYYLPG